MHNCMAHKDLAWSVMTNDCRNTIQKCNVIHTCIHTSIILQYVALVTIVVLLEIVAGILGFVYRSDIVRKKYCHTHAHSFTHTHTHTHAHTHTHTHTLIHKHCFTCEHTHTPQEDFVDERAMLAIEAYRFNDSVSDFNRSANSAVDFVQSTVSKSG